MDRMSSQRKAVAYLNQTIELWLFDFVYISNETTLIVTINASVVIFFPPLRRYRKSNKEQHAFY